MKKLIFIFLILLISPILVSAKEYYVDCSKSTNGVGIFNSPWNNIQSVNNNVMKLGDDVYFKVGTTCKPSKKLHIDWNGSSTNRVIIGPYYDKGGSPGHGLNENPRPILDGQSHTVPNKWEGMIQIHGRYKPQTGYITVKDFKIVDSGHNGISLVEVDNVILDNNYMYNTYGGAGIVMASSQNSVISNNRIEKASLGPGAGAGIEVTNMFKKDMECKNNLIVNNTITRAHEGIGLYKGASYNIVEGNTIYDCNTYHIYVSEFSHHNIVRSNIVYASAEWKRPWIGIVLGCEAWACESNRYAAPGISCSDYNEVYNNLVTKFVNGIGIGPEQGCVDIGRVPQGNKFYNNIVADCTYNIKFKNTGPGNVVKNTLSYTSSSSFNHIHPSINSKMSFDNNLFDDSSGVSGTKADNNAIFGDPKLKKTSGWDSITPGTAKADWWRPQEGSKAIDKGLDLGSPYNIDFDGKTRPSNKWDVGAFEYGSMSCSENWQCSAWSSWSTCVNDKQTRTRTCTDANNCGTNNGKPIESETQDCSTTIHDFETQISEDSLMESMYPDYNYGGWDTFYIGSRNNNWGSRFLLRFPGIIYSTNIPKGSKIDSAEIILTHTGNQKITSPINLKVRKVIESWTEGDNLGTLADSEETTWNYRSYNTQAWTNEGGSHTTTDEVSKSYSTNPSDGQQSTFDITKIVQSWSDNGESSNHGFLLLAPGEEKSSLNYVRFATSEHTNTNYRPKLIVDYSSGKACGPADANSNNIIDLTELIDHIKKWKNAQITSSEINTALNNWKNGC